MTKNDVIDILALTPHPTEGGYFRRTYESAHSTKIADESRKIASSIYYMLTDDSQHGYLHRNKSDIIHCHHCGSPIRYTIISANGTVQHHVLGSDLSRGETPQLIVQGGDWKISELTTGEYGLISEVVAPGFEYQDNEIATLNQIATLFPTLIDSVRKFIKT